MFEWLVVAAVAGVATPDASQQSTQQQPTQDYREEVVVTAALERETRTELPVAATVIGADEIRRRQATEIHQVLGTVAGLDVVQSGSPGKVVSLFSRGAESNQSLVLWNGIPLNDPFFGGYDWAFLPTDGVGRVEVVRGPFSSLYGSDAMGGVIQVLSQRSSGGRARAEAGNDSYGRLGLSWGEDLGALRLDVAGHVRRGDGAAENDFYDSEELMGRVEWRAGESSTLGVLMRRAQNEIGIPVASGVATPRRTQESDGLQLAIPFVLESGDWRVETQLSRSQADFVFRDPDAVFSLSETDAERLRLRGVARYRAGETFWIAGGAEWQQDEVTNDTNFGANLSDVSRDGWAAFAELQKRIGPVRFDLGVRRDDDEYFGAHTSPRGGVIVDLGDEWQVFASYGEGFRAPSLGELFFPFFGSPDLEPEESRSAEAGLRWAGEPWWVAVTYFDTDFENLIDSDPLTFTAVNVGRAEADGWEIEAGYRRGLVELRGNVTLLEARDLDTGLDLLRRPDQRANLLVAVRPADFAVQLTGRWVGERVDLDPVTFTRSVNDDYFVADLALTWTASETLAPYARLANLADESYEEVLGFPSPGRTFAVGLEVQWP